MELINRVSDLQSCKNARLADDLAFSFLSIAVDYSFQPRALPRQECIRKMNT